MPLRTPSTDRRAIGGWSATGFTWTPLAIADYAWWALTVVLAVGLFVPGRLVGDGPGLRRFLTPEITGNVRIAQTFRMNARNMNAVEIYAAAVGPVDGKLHLKVTDLTADPNVVRSADVAAADVARRGSYLFAFESIERSRNHQFRLDITSSSDSPARGVAFWATKGARLPEATLYINDVRRWADLAFQTYAPMPAQFQALLQTRDAARLPHWLGLVCLIVVWIAVRFLLRVVANLAQEATAPQDVPCVR
jgi:hypothetical protein